MLNIANSIFFALTFTASPWLAQAFESSIKISESQALKTIEEAPADIKNILRSSPAVYSFKSPEGLSSVAYQGQTFRQVLISDIKAKVYSVFYGAYPGQPDVGRNGIDSLFRYGRTFRTSSPLIVDSSTAIGVSLKSATGEPLDFFDGFGGGTYGEVFEKGTSLEAKLAGVDQDTLAYGTLLGWRAKDRHGVVFDLNQDGQLSPLEFVDGLMTEVGKNGASDEQELVFRNGSLGEEVLNSAAFTKDGLDIAQLLQKFLHGAVAFSQASADYMSFHRGDGEGLAVDGENNFQKEASNLAPYTLLEHYWDEGFGYFGAARDYGSYSLDDVASGVSLDSFSEEETSNGFALIHVGEDNGDALISLQHEKNFGMSVNAAKRDLGSGEVSQFKERIFNAFLKGRTLIQSRSMTPAKMKVIRAYSVIAISQWEKLLAANTIHYINKTVKDYRNYGTPEFSFASFFKHFSEMKGFALAFQFNPNSSFDRSSFARLHGLMRDTPVVPTSSIAESQKQTQGYVQQLLMARALLVQTMGFTAANGFEPKTVDNW